MRRLSEYRSLDAFTASHAEAIRRAVEQGETPRTFEMRELFRRAASHALTD